MAGKAALWGAALWASPRAASVRAHPDDPWDLTKNCFAFTAHSADPHTKTHLCLKFSISDAETAQQHHPEPSRARGEAAWPLLCLLQYSKGRWNKQEDFCPWCRCSSAVPVLATGYCGCWCFLVVHREGAQVRNWNPPRLLKTQKAAPASGNLCC